MPNLPTIFDRNTSISNPLRSFEKMQRQMNQFFNRMWSAPELDLDLIPSEVSFSPACNIEELDSHYVLSFDVPGVKKDDVKIDIRGNMLTVSGERKEATEQKKSTFYKSEASYGFFQRSFELPADVKANQIEAQYENGVLRVAIPKTEASKSQSVKISEGKEGFWGNLLGHKKEDAKTQPH